MTLLGQVPNFDMGRKKKNKKKNQWVALCTNTVYLSIIRAENHQSNWHLCLHSFNYMRNNSNCIKALLHTESKWQFWLPRGRKKSEKWSSFGKKSCHGIERKAISQNWASKPRVTTHSPCSYKLQCLGKMDDSNLGHQALFKNDKTLFS